MPCNTAVSLHLMCDSKITLHKSVVFSLSCESPRTLFQLQKHPSGDVSTHRRGKANISPGFDDVDRSSMRYEMPKIFLQESSTVPPRRLQETSTASQNISPAGNTNCPNTPRLFARSASLDVIVNSADGITRLPSRNK